MANVTHAKVAKPGQPSAAANMPANANGRANSVCWKRTSAR